MLIGFFLLYHVYHAPLLASKLIAAKFYRFFHCSRRKMTVKWPVITRMMTSYLSWNDLKVNCRFFFSSWCPGFIFFDSSSDRGLVRFQRSRSRNFRIRISRYRARFESTRTDVRNQLWSIWTRIWTRVWAPAVIGWSRCNRACWTRRTRAAVR